MLAKSAPRLQFRKTELANSPVLAYGFAEPVGMGATGVFIGDALTNVVIVVLAGLYLLRGTWTDNVIEDEPGSDPADTGEYSTAASSRVEDD